MRFVSLALLWAPTTPTLTAVDKKLSLYVFFLCWQPGDVCSGCAPGGISAPRDPNPNPHLERCRLAMLLPAPETLTLTLTLSVAGCQRAA